MRGQLWRQGDVLIMAVDTLPDGSALRRDHVLAHGEVTGHSHRVESPERAELWNGGGRLYLHVLEATRIVHEEHHPIPLEPGMYLVWQQREYIPPSQRGYYGGVQFASFRSVRD